MHRTIHITVKNAQKTLTRSDADSDTDAKGIRLAPLNFIPVSKKEKGKLLGKDSIHVHFVHVPLHYCIWNIFMQNINKKDKIFIDYVLIIS